MTQPDEPQDTAGAEREQPGDDEQVVARLRAELDAARERVHDAWQRYESALRRRDVPAIAGAPLASALMTVLQQHA